MRIAASVVSLLLAAGFVAFGVTVLLALEATPWIRAFGGLTVAYGLASGSVLVFAWRTSARKWSRLAASLCVEFWLLWTGASFDHGMISGHELIAAIGVAFALTPTWYAVRIVERRPPNMPVQPTSPGDGMR